MSPSAKRAWIEITLVYAKDKRTDVALCEEGVDRNLFESENALVKMVALCEEGVDRNKNPVIHFITSLCRPLRRGRG